MGGFFDCHDCHDVMACSWHLPRRRGRTPELAYLIGDFFYNPVGVFSICLPNFQQETVLLNMAD